MATSPAQSSQVKSATRTLDIIEYVVAHPRPLVAQEIATALGIPVSSLSYLLATLVDRDYLVREGRRYSPGPGLEKLQMHGASYTLADRAAPLVRTLRVQLNETASFWVREGWEVEALVTESSEQALRYAVPIGNRMPLHPLASGKALLARLSEAELDRYFAEADRQRFTPATVTAEKALRKEIAEIRRTGVSWADEEFSLGIIGIGRAVTIGGETAGALSVAIPKVRCDEVTRRRIEDLLERTAGLLEAV
jgi:IclR family acetate operon transcriptional repressor